MTLGQIISQDESRTLIDKKTGQKFFQPVLSKASLNISRSLGELWKHNPCAASFASDAKQPNTSSALRESASKSGSKLLVEKNVNSSSLPKKSPKTPTAQTFGRKPPINKESMDKIAKREQALAQTLFEMLDSDYDGTISADKISISDIPTYQLKLLYPLLAELEELNQTLTLEEFRAALSTLLKSMTPQDRSLFYFGPKEQQTDPNLTFRPRINQASRRMSQNLRPYGSRALYDHYMREKEVRAVDPGVQPGDEGHARSVQRP